MSADPVISELLDRRGKWLGELQAVLALERDALRDNNPVLLDEATSRKMAAIRALEQLDGEQRQLCEAFDVDTNEAGFTSLLDPAELSCWYTQHEQGETCRQLNSVNGRLLGSRLRQVSEALNILHNGDTASNSYGADGRMVTAPFGRSLISV